MQELSFETKFTRLDDIKIKVSRSMIRSSRYNLYINGNKYQFSSKKEIKELGELLSRI